MRRGAWLGASLVYVVVACNTTYTAPATACDDWCEATHGVQCDYDPAGCVSACEHAAATDQLDCSASRRAVMDCFVEHPEAKDFLCPGFVPASPCWDVISPLSACEAGLYPNECASYCASLASTLCPTPSTDNCIFACESDRLGSPSCEAQRDAVVACAAQLHEACDPNADPDAIARELDPETLPCKRERDALEACGLKLVPTYTGSVGGAPSAEGD